MIKGAPTCVRVEIGSITGVAHGMEDWSPKDPFWGFMHLRCFYLAIGDARGSIPEMPEIVAVPLPLVVEQRNPVPTV